MRGFSMVFMEYRIIKGFILINSNRILSNRASGYNFLVKFIDSLS